MYLLMKWVVLVVVEKEVDLKFVKRFEVEEVDEFSEVIVLEELYLKVEVKKVFGWFKRLGC